MYAPFPALIANLVTSSFSFIAFSAIGLLYLGFLAKSIFLKSSMHNSSLFMRFVCNLWMLIGIIIVILNLFLSFFKFVLTISHFLGRTFFLYLILPNDSEQMYFYKVLESIFYYLGFEIEKIILHFSILILLFASVFYVYVVSQEILVELKIFEAFQFQITPKLIGPIGRFMLGNQNYKKRSLRIGFEKGISSPKISIFNMKSKIFLLVIMAFSFILFFCVNMEPVVRLLLNILSTLFPSDWIFNFILELICTILVFVPYCLIAGFCSILFFFIVKSKMDTPKKFKIESLFENENKDSSQSNTPGQKKSQIEEMDEINEIYDIKETTVKKAAIQSVIPILSMTLVLVFMNIIFGIHSFMIDIEFFIGFGHTKLIFICGLLALFIQNVRLSKRLTQATKKLEDCMNKIDKEDELISQTQSNKGKTKAKDKSTDDELKFVEQDDDDEDEEEAAAASKEHEIPIPSEKNEIERPSTPIENLKDKFVLDENDLDEHDQEDEELIK